MPIEKTRGSTLGWPASPLAAAYAFLPPRPLRLNCSFGRIGLAPKVVQDDASHQVAWHRGIEPGGDSGDKPARAISRSPIDHTRWAFTERDPIVVDAVSRAITSASAPF